MQLRGGAVHPSAPVDLNEGGAEACALTSPFRGATEGIVVLYSRGSGFAATARRRIVGSPHFRDEFMRHVIVLSVLGLGACASGPSQTSSQTETVRVFGGGGTSASTAIGIRNTTSANASRLGYPIDRVWRALPAAYDSLKIPLTTLDANKHFIGNEGMKIRQRLGTVALSTYIDCGQAQIGPSADSYDIFLAVTTTVRSLSATETELATTIEAAGKPVAFAQDYARCGTRGIIETKIAAIVGARLAAGAK
jgi:hypothetical protein